MDDFSLARPVGHLIMWDGSGPDGLAEKDGARRYPELNRSTPLPLNWTNRQEQKT